MADPIRRVVLAFSGGLDTSVILKWLQQRYGCEVVTFTADLGQGEELEPARSKAEMMGVKPEHIFIRFGEEFVSDFVPVIAPALYEAYCSHGDCTADACQTAGGARRRPARALAQEHRKGNDQCVSRRGLCSRRHQGDAPWREGTQSRPR